MKNRTLFISDLHLQESEPHITALFDKFMREHAPSAEAVYILGDLFEVWIGDDDLNEFNLSIINKIRNCVENGTPVFFVPGNRDFLIGKKFAELTSCTILTDPTVISLYNKNVLLLHGDTLCTNDKVHQNYRRIIQHPMVKSFLQKLLPLFMRRYLSESLRKQSRRHTRRQTAHIMDVINTSVIEQFQTFNAPIMLHGHTHRPLIETLYIDDKTYTRYVLGAWHQWGSILQISADHAIEYLNIT